MELETEIIESETALDGLGRDQVLTGTFREACVPTWACLLSPVA